MISACQFTPEISGMIQARHEFAADHRYPSVTVSRAGLREVWTEAWLGLVLDRWQLTGHGSDQPGGNMGTKPNAQAWRQIAGPVP
jgi:hypothetical protein